MENSALNSLLLSGMPIRMHALLKATLKCSDEIGKLRFAKPVTHVYNPFEYALAPYEQYLEKYATPIPKKVLYLGMNPGPFGMAQIGIPFGEIASARDWLKLSAPIGKPKKENAKRPIQGFDCPKSEVSGRRLWSFFAQEFGTPERFFKDHFVINYCPLVFMEESGRNVTPDKLPAKERARLFALCDELLQATVEILQPQWIIGVGAFAETRAREVLEGSPLATRLNLKFARILHPSPASPAANKGWAEKVKKELSEILG